MNLGTAWPMVGRSRELRIIAEALADPALHGVVLVGSRGVGSLAAAGAAAILVGAAALRRSRRVEASHFGA